MLPNIILGIGIMAAVFGVGTTAMMWSRPSFRGNPLEWIKANYTMRRWVTHEWQVFACGLMWQATIWQLVLGNQGQAIRTVARAGEVDFRAWIFLAISNLIGSSFCFYSLHMRDQDLSMTVELLGYLSLTGTLIIWIVLVYVQEPLPNTGFGLNLTEAFVLASIVRAVKIIRYKDAHRRRDVATAVKLRQMLNF